jgi:hypothetical protein
MSGPTPGKVAGMAAGSWWERCNDDVRRLHDTGWDESTSILSQDICELLVDVDTAFTVTGAHTPEWPNPYKDGSDLNEAAYERATNPEKYLIVVARAQAWTKVLLDRGWAREASPVRWALRPSESGGADTVLEPVTGVAVPLVLTTHTPVDRNHPFNISIAAGNPAVCLASIPDCACDGCDRGSAAPLEEMDRWVLSVVDGSLQVEVTADYSSIRTSFGGQGGTVQYLDEPTSFTATPWPTSWTPRPLTTPITTPHPEPPFPRTVFGTTARGAYRRLLGKPKVEGASQIYRSTDG